MCPLERGAPGRGLRGLPCGPARERTSPGASRRRLGACTHAGHSGVSRSSFVRPARARRSREYYGWQGGAGPGSRGDSGALLKKRPACRPAPVLKDTLAHFEKHASVHLWSTHLRSHTNQYLRGKLQTDSSRVLSPPLPRVTSSSKVSPASCAPRRRCRPPAAGGSALPDVGPRRKSAGYLRRAPRGTPALARSQRSKSTPGKSPDVLLKLNAGGVTSRIPPCRRTLDSRTLCCGSDVLSTSTWGPCSSLLIRGFCIPRV